MGPGHRRTLGAHAEDIASRYLVGQGLRPIARNYRCRGGEIDLIMQDSNSLVFIEVRYRKDARFGTPAATVTPAKQRKLTRAALHYLQSGKHDLACRFDVIGIHGSGNAIEWIKNAFDVV